MKFTLTGTRTTILLLLTALTSCKKHDHNWDKIINETSSDDVSDSQSTKETEENNDYNIKIRSKFKIIDFHGELRKKFALTAASKNPQSSLVCSPISALLPLGKLVFGAESKTNKELLKAIGVSRDKEVSSHFTKLLSSMKKIGGSVLTVASRIYLSDKKYLLGSFRSRVEKIFGASIEMVNMRNPVSVANSVNNWVNHETRGYIKELIKASDLSPDLSLMLVNAICFKDQWKQPFVSEHYQTFYGASGERSVPLMTVTGEFEYGEARTLGSHVVVMPYKHGDVSMMIILPDAQKGLNMLLNQLRLAPELINSIKLTKQKVKLFIPRFKIESELDLKELYKLIGLESTMSSNFGFKSIVKGEIVYISKAIQKAVIEVSLNGTTAAAASAIFGFGAGAPDLKVPVFRADHPFIFYIKSNREQLFAGIYT